MAGNCASWTISAFSIIAFALAVTSVAHCRFALLVFDGVDYSDLPGLGLFKFENFDENCESYPDEVKDDVFEAQEKVARAFGVITCLLTGFAMVMVVVVTLFLDVPKISKTLWTCVKIFYGISVFSQIATFAFFASDLCIDTDDVGIDLCVPGPAGIVAGLNVVLLSVVSCMACATVTPEPVHSLCKSRSTTAHEQEGDEVPYNASGRNYDPMDMEQENANGAVEVPYNQSQVGAASTVTTVTIGKDGTKTTTETVTNPDGSKTTTVTTEKEEGV